jgi:RNA polymerase sigma factor (sigma-70 family)
MNPFDEHAGGDATDLELAAEATAGSRPALERLIRRHQGWIYNIAVRMVCDPSDAEDVTQEVLVKVVTKLGSFQGKSAFRTWLYRVVANHVLNMKHRPLEAQGPGFVQLGDRLDAMADQDLPDPDAVPVDLPLLVEETKVRCTAGMLLCLDRRQRLVFTLGEFFNVNHNVAAEILETTPDNFRQLLARARRELYNFMENKCGLVNAANPCRCAKKTQAMISSGAVDPHRLQFVPEHVTRVEEVAPRRSITLDVLDQRYASIFAAHPFLTVPDNVTWLRGIVESDEFREALEP